MKKLGILLASIFVMMLATQRVNAEDPATATASADVTATIVQAISIDKITDLKFGKIVASSTAGKVAIETNGEKSIIEGGVALFDQESDEQAASFKTIGSPGAAYYLVLPEDESVELTGPPESDPMTIEGFEHSATGILDAATGEETFNVGATLKVGANQAPGQYKGTFSVTAVYN